MRKRSGKARGPATGKLDFYDQAMWHGQNIAALAELLQHCSRSHGLDFSTVAQAGAMILEESCDLQECLQELKP